MGTTFFSVAVLLLSGLYTLASRKLLNTFTLLSLPYLLIILINKYYMASQGFDDVEPNTMKFLCLSFFIFWVGGMLSLFWQQFINHKKWKTNVNNSQYNYRTMFYYVTVIGLIVFVQLFVIIKTHGLAYIGSEEFSGRLLGGIVGKLMITTYPLAPILLYAWFEHKRSFHFFLAYMGILLLTFLTFVKYHIISLILITFIYLYFKKRKCALQSGLVFVIGIPLVFILNYLVSFKVRGITVDNSFYIQHLWNYVGGSIINDNNALNFGFRQGTSVMYKLGIFILPLANMILSPIGIELPHHEELAFSQIGTTGEMRTNVIDQFAYLFDSYKFGGRTFYFILIVLIFGILAEFFINKLRYPKNDGSLLFAACFATFFLVLGFFGTFYVQPVPWLWMIFSWLMPKLFKKKVVYNSDPGLETYQLDYK